MSPTVVWADADGEIQVYDTNVGEFQTLNVTAAAIWRQLVERGERDAIVAGLAAEFGAQDDNQRRLIGTDTDRLLSELAGSGLIVAEPVSR